MDIATASTLGSDCFTVVRYQRPSILNYGQTLLRCSNSRAPHLPARYPHRVQTFSISCFVLVYPFEVQRAYPRTHTTLVLEAFNAIT